MKNKYLFLILFLISAVFFASAPPACAQDTDPVSVLPVSPGEADQLLSEARNFLSARDYRSAINRLETVIFIKKTAPDDVRELVTEAYARQIEEELARKNYKEAISLNIKILNLRQNFDFVWINKLMNIYMLSGNFRKTHDLCMELLKKQDLLALPAENLAKIYGKLAVVYSQFKDAPKTLEWLLKAAEKDPSVKALQTYAAMIFPGNIESKLLLDQVNTLVSQQKHREAYIMALVYSSVPGADSAAASKIIQETLKLKPELKSIASAQKASTTGEAAVAPAGLIENHPETSSVVLTNVPSQLKDSGVNLPSSSASRQSAASGEFDILMSRADELFAHEKYSDAVAEYEKAQKIAPEKLKKDVERKMFSAYWRSQEDFIKIFAYSAILVILLVLFYYFNPLSFFNREQYSLINVSKTIRTGLGFMEEKKYQKAAAELEKLVEMKLSNTETIILYLNLGIAYYNMNSFANSLMALKRVLQFDYENVDAYKFLGKIYLKTRDRSHRAMEVFNFLIDRNMAEVEMLKAVLAYNAAQNVVDDRTVQIATALLSNEPNNETAGKLLIKYFNRVKRIDDEAVRFTEKYIENYPRDIDTRVIYLELLYRRKEYSKIASECSVLFSYAIDNILIHSIFIDSIVNLNKPQMLVTEYERLLHENPGSIITNFICQSMKSIIVDKKRVPQVDYAVAVRVNFTVCNKCFHLNLNEFNNCQRCGNALKM